MWIYYDLPFSSDYRHNDKTESNYMSGNVLDYCSSRTSWIMGGEMIKTTSEFMCLLAVNIVNEVLWLTEVSISDHK